MDSASYYSIAKALHLIGMASWMAGMFYLVRIMVYHAMANKKEPAKREILATQFSAMEWKAYKIILRPAVYFTWTFGLVMLWIQPVWFKQGWMQVKFVLLFFLTWYSLGLVGHIKRLEAGTSRYTHLQFRALNEVPTIFLVGIVFLAVFKDRISFPALFAGLALFTGLIAWGIWKANRKEDGSV